MLINKVVSGKCKEEKEDDIRYYCVNILLLITSVSSDLYVFWACVSSIYVYLGRLLQIDHCKK